MTQRYGHAFQDRSVSDGDYWVSPDQVLRAPLPLTPERRRMLWDLVSSRPQAVSKAGAGIRAEGGLRRHLQYISREGDLPLYGRDGARLEDQEDISRLADSWVFAANLDSQRTPRTVLARPLTLAAPRGSEPAAVHRAVWSFAEREFAPRFDYAFAFHRDTAYPHAHLVIKALGDQGERLSWNPEQLEAQRMRYAATLRRHGVEVSATPRFLRGLPGRGMPDRHLRLARDFVRRVKRGERSMDDAPNTLKAVFADGGELLAGGVVSQPEREARVRAGRQRLTEGLDDLIGRLERSEDVDDRRLAQALDRHRQRLPLARTDRERYAAYRLERHREREAAAERAWEQEQQRSWERERMREAELELRRRPLERERTR